MAVNAEVPVALKFLTLLKFQNCPKIVMKFYLFSRNVLILGFFRPSDTETLTDLQLFGSELHQNVFGDQAMCGLAGGSIALPQT